MIRAPCGAGCMASRHEWGLRLATWGGGLACTLRAVVEGSVVAQACASAVGGVQTTLFAGRFGESAASRDSRVVRARNRKRSVRFRQCEAELVYLHFTVLPCADAKQYGRYSSLGVGVPVVLGSGG